MIKSIPRVGLGCMGMSEFYGETNDQSSLKSLEYAFELGYRHFDTADMYGCGHNEQLLGKFLKSAANERENIFLASKVGIRREKGTRNIAIDSSPEYILKACDESLERLELEYIDLYYLHRRNSDVPIDETMSALKELKEQGKIKGIGLCEVSAETLKKASEICKVDALQNEYSLWSRDIENGMLQTCIELDTSLVAYSPIGRGFLSGALKSESLNQDDLRLMLPRFQPEAFEKNQLLLKAINDIADECNATGAQVSLTWLLQQHPSIIVIPGARKFNHIKDNFGAIDLTLSQTQIDYLSDAFAREKVTGERYPSALLATVNN